MMILKMRILITPDHMISCTSLPHSRQPLRSASQIRRLSVVTIGNNNVHLLKCIPLYDFPVEENFILLSKHVRDQLGCYSLENLLISLVEHHGHQGINFVAIIKVYKEDDIPKHTVYVPYIHMHDPYYICMTLLFFAMSTGYHGLIFHSQHSTYIYNKPLYLATI